MLAALVTASMLALAAGCHGADHAARTTEPAARRGDPGDSPTEAEPQQRAATPSPTPSATTVRLVDPHGKDVPVTWYDMTTASDAAGSNDFDLVSRLEGSSACKDSVSPGALFDDGAWFALIVPGAICSWQGNGPLPASGRVGIVSKGSTAPRPWAPTSGLVPGDHHRQVTRSPVSGDRAVWFETTSTDLGDDNWRLFAADRRTGEPHVVATAEELTGGKQLPFSEATATVYRHRVYWSTTPASAAGTQRAFEPEVVSKDISGKGTITLAAKVGDQPVTTDRGVVIRTASTMEVDDVDDQDRPSVVAERIPSGFSLVTAHGLEPLLRASADGPIARNEAPGAVAASGHTLAFAIGDTEYLYDLDTGTALGFRGAGRAIPVPGDQAANSDAQREATTIHSSAVTSSVAVWTFGGGSGSLRAPVLVYDARDHTLRRVWVSHNDGEVWAAAAFVGWSGFRTLDASRTTTLASWR